MKRVVLAMSGGVDSSVAAWLLSKAGYEVIGLFMRHGVVSQTECDAPDSANAAMLPVVDTAVSHKKGCCTAADAADARRVAAELDIPFYAVNFDESFGRIMDYFAEEYSLGRTPNPCIVCNNWIKFGKLWDYAQDLGADSIATGHYARLAPATDGGGVPALLRGRDANKDQSYVLCGIQRELLNRILFPVGGYAKREIREIARRLDLRVADKRDSQEICFVPDGDYAGFVRRRHGNADLSGEIVTTDGKVIGRHQGIESFTIGQRKGLGIALGEPHYVVRLDAPEHRVIVGTKDELGRRELTAAGVNWLVREPAEALCCDVQIRYASRPAHAMVEPLPEGRLRVEFDEPQYGVAPGQLVACYRGEQLLGGGWIE